MWYRENNIHEPLVNFLKQREFDFNNLYSNLCMYIVSNKDFLYNIH